MFVIDKKPYSRRTSMMGSLCLLGWPTQVSTPFGGLTFAGGSAPGRRGWIPGGAVLFSGGRVSARS